MPRNSPGPETRIDADTLERFVRDVLTEAGVAPEHADRVAHALVRAELRGVDSHGVARLEAYVEKFERRGFNPDPDIRVEQLADGAVLVDADDGPGQSAGVVAMDAAMDRADDVGVGIAGVTNSNHFGTAAYYTERASDAGYVGLAMTNVGSDVIPYGGIAPFLGTNPISFSIPTDREFAITLDMATSVVAMGKIDHAAKDDDTLPDDWAVDADGETTTRPEDVAALRPVGGPKGFGLGIVVDALCGILTGVGTSPAVGPLYDAFDEPMRLGHFLAAIDVDAFRDIEDFRHDVGDYISHLKDQPTRDGVDQIRLPGEFEAAARRRNLADGVQLNDDARRGIESLAARYDVALPTPMQ